MSDPGVPEMGHRGLTPVPQNYIITLRGRYELLDTYENYIGSLIQGERLRRGLKITEVCGGICSIGAYAKLEAGEYAGGIHVLRAICQRLGINQERCGTYFAQAEYDEMLDRLYILEDIRAGRMDEADKRLAQYKDKYKDIPLNRQFISFMQGRLLELEGNVAEALNKYDEAIRYTVPEYCCLEQISCLTIYEAFMMLDAARLSAELGDKENACRLYMLLLKYCDSTKVEKWNLVCVYPKTVCELTDIVGIDNMDSDERQVFLAHFMSALDVLRSTSRFYYIRPVLANIISLKQKTNATDVEVYRELLNAVNSMLEEHEHGRELFEWYPYYVDCGFRCVNELINERRCMYGMSIEELAGTIKSPRNIQRIVKGQISPSYNTQKEILDKLGLNGILRSDIIVADNMEMHKLWEKISEYVSARDFDNAETAYEQLKLSLTKEEINQKALAYMRIKLDLNENKIDLQTAATRLIELLPFAPEDVKKYNQFLKLEEMILCDYLYWKKDIPIAEWNELFDEILGKYECDELTKKRFAVFYEGICIIGANYLGDRGEYDKSDRIALKAIELDMECERMSVLPSLLYNMAWNKQEQGQVTAREIQLCQCAYVLAKHAKDDRRVTLYENWLKRNKN